MVLIQAQQTDRLWEKKLLVGPLECKVSDTCYVAGADRPASEDNLRFTSVDTLRNMESSCGIQGNPLSVAILSVVSHLGLPALPLEGSTLPHESRN